MSIRLQPGGLALGHFRSVPAARTRRRVVPEARKKLAGGEAQRNHRTSRPSKRCAPAGRESRQNTPTRLASAAFSVLPDSRSSPAELQGGREVRQCRRVAVAKRVGGVSRLSRPAGAKRSLVRFFRWFRCASPPANFLRASGTKRRRRWPRGRQPRKKGSVTAFAFDEDIRVNDPGHSRIPVRAS